MDAYLRRKAPEKIGFAANLAVVSGSGAGQPLGFLNSPALVSVAKETSQVADTLIATNLIKMYSRMYAPSRSRAVWLVNQDIEQTLEKIDSILKAERLKRVRQEGLESFIGKL